MKKYLTLDVVIGIILILFSGWFWYLSLAFPEAAQMFPQLFLTVTFLLSVLLLISSVTAQANKIKKGVLREGDGFLKQFAMPCKAYCIMVLYIIGIRSIGFFVATSVFTAAFMYFLKVRKPLVLLGVTAGMDVFLYAMFCVGLKLSLPAGILF
ncbi:tripartite tricarboxylate transporter TctB family protein [Clostridium transplantifaecale]|uniref:tripartite tricarboxylate transporter TctB family protein n=1 Tax=Clostridium transplantifaecale TaxID=2479838 RepID=UPI000F63ECE9|nr:tripartite tricarboxylate transporter TctB family protein [Clostridium transplantifaecale]